MTPTDPRSLRQQNFQRTVKAIGLSKIVDITGRQRSQISDCAAGRRTIGEKLARRLEIELSLEPGSLDLPDIGGSGVEISTVGQHRVPLLPWAAVTEPQGIEPIDVLLTNMDLSAEAFALRIADSSMSPAFNIGDIVIIDPNISPAPGDYVVAIAYDEAVFRRFRRNSQESFRLIPNNQDFPPLDSGDEVKIIGVMVEHRIYRHR